MGSTAFIIRFDQMSDTVINSRYLIKIKRNGKNDTDFKTEHNSKTNG